MPSYTTQGELDFEKQIVEQLSTGSNQWEERKDLYGATPDQLWDNFRTKLNRNNIAELDHKELTDEEFDRVKSEINKIKSPYDAAKMLDSENGIGKIDIQRDDSSQGYVTLNIFWKADVNGGHSSYEIVRQARRPKGLLEGDDQNRRFDVTLLINGLPLIQLELKKSTVEITQAFNQIKKYAKEGKYTGIYSLLQMFVIMSPDATEYFANCEPDDFNKSFLFKWRDKDNHLVENGMDFAKAALNIPMAHKLVSEYTAIDEERKKLLLLRPYQIYAIEAVMKRIAQHENGYVWHTTGSGKTLTSYKTAKLAAQLPAVDRVVFLVDRKALDDQTVGNFTAYAANDDMNIKQTNNTSHLRKELLEAGNNIIVTSIQKMSNLVHKEEEAQKEGRNTRISSVLNKRICFFVDEAHRTQFGKMRQDVKNAFINANWYGYTGTPIFYENHKKIKGDRGVTTEDLFGKVCHVYNLRNALEDHAVLPFNVEHVNTLDNEEQIAHDILLKQYAKANEKYVNELSPADRRDFNNEFNDTSMVKKEKVIPNKVYENDAHLDQVVNYILSVGPKKMSLGKGNYNAILTTSSIPMAIRYYRKIKAQKQVHPNAEDKDWPRVAITYSLAENNDSHEDNAAGMREAIADYNEMFGTNFHNDNEEIELYNEDVAKRAARREDQYAHLPADKEINLVIVVRRLLTGFDAPRLNTLFVDNIFDYANLIQAYSRTNRLENNDLKQEGQIVTFRKPALTEYNEKEAYRVYGGEGSYEEIIRPKYEDAVDKFKSQVASLKRIAATPDAVDELAGQHDKGKFVRTFRTLMTKLNSLSMYDKFTWDNSEEVFGLAEDEVQHYVGKFNRIKEEVEQSQDKDDNDELENLDFSLSVGSTTLVDYDYITGLLKELVTMRPSYDSDEKVQENMTEYLQKETEIQEKIDEYEKSGHAKEAELLREILAELDKQHVQPDNFDEFVTNYKQNKLNNLVNDFANKWGLDKNNLIRVARERTHGTEEGSHMQNLLDQGDTKQAAKQQDNPQLAIPLLYNNIARSAVESFIDKEINIYL